MELHQGDIAYFDLNPAKGSETKKIRPCLIVSDNHYNRYFNTVVIIPISSSDKYQTEERFKKSPLYVDIQLENVKGTALLQHIRAIDSKVRLRGKIIGKIVDEDMAPIVKKLKRFF